MVTPVTMPSEASLLLEALEVPAERIRLLSREPVGDGSIAGFFVQDDDGAETIAYVDTSGRAVAAETGLALSGVGRIWTHPADPHVRALPAVAFGDAIAVLLARIDETPTGDAEMIAYRAGRRAVLRVPTANGDLWLKVVRPHHAERIVAAHTAFVVAGVPVPTVRAWSPEGLLIIESATGLPAGQFTGPAQTLIDAVDELRGAFADVELARPSRADMPARLGWYRDRLIASAPERTGDVDRIAADIEECLRGATAVRSTVHGDLHVGQLFLTGGGEPRVSGLIDVDTAGSGAVAEDAAAFTSHAAASALLTPHAAGAAAMADLAVAAHTRWGSDQGVTARVAIQLLGHTVQALDRGDAECADRMLRSASRSAKGRAPLDS